MGKRIKKYKSKFEKMTFLEKIAILLGLCAISVLIIMLNNFPWPILHISLLPLERFDFINACVAFGTILSASGLIYFGDRTYRNQKASEFYSMFPVLLEQHDLVLKDCFDNNNSLIKIYGFIIRRFPGPNNSDLETRMKYYIDDIFNYSEFKRYFILLYRILKYIDEQKTMDRKTYTSMVRTKIPFSILFILVLHSHKNDKTYLKYRKLLYKYHFLEHLPLNNPDWVINIFPRPNNNHKHHARFFLSRLMEFREQRNKNSPYFSKKIWGDNIYH